MAAKTITITLADCGPAESSTRRLRALLKALLRSYRWRCVSCQPLVDIAPPEEPKVPPMGEVSPMGDKGVTHGR